MRQYRQGDVLLVEIAPNEVSRSKREREERGILALGEVTGHSHVIDPAKANVFFDDELSSLIVNDRGLIVEVHASSAWLRHDEHDPIEIPKGFYRRIIQREYAPEAFHRVRD